MCAWCSQQEFVPETIPSCHQRIKDPSTKVGTTAKSVAPVADLGQNILVKQARAHVQRYFLGTDPMQANPPTTRFSCRPAISEMDKFPMDWVVFFARSTWSNCWAAGPCLYFRSWNSQWSHDFQRFSKKENVLSKWQSSVTGTYWNNCWSNLMIWVSQHFWNPPCGYCLSSIQLAADSTWSGWKRRSNSLKRLCGLRWIWNGNPHFGIGNHPLKITWLWV